jgi:hypothetical protein
MRRCTKRRGVLALVLALGLLTSACGDASLPTFDDPVKGDRVDPASFLEALSTSFRSGSTARVSFEVRGGTGLSGTGSVRYTAEAMDASLKIDDWKVDGAFIDIRTVGGTTYMRVPESRGLWVNVSEHGTPVPGADLAQDADPRRGLDDLRENLTEVRFSGTEALAGVRTKRFQVVSDPASGSGAPAVTQYWFDGRGRVLRRQSDLQQSGSVTFIWSKWGQPVSIKRPRKGTVVTLEQLEKLRKQQQSSAGGSGG